ncbi:MAG: glycosyltransferase family 2 protein, partial [Nitrososphaerales archaeon]
MSQNQPESSRPKVSIVIPVYNGGPLLRKMLDSVFNQRDVSFEVLVVDDHSTDETPTILKDIVAHHPFTLVTHETNLGLAASLNEGISRANGDYVMTLHQDCELIIPDWLERALQIFKEGEKVGIVTGKSIYDTSAFDIYQKAFMIINRHGTPKYDSSIQEVAFSEDKCDLYDMKLLKDIGGFPEEKFRVSGEDQYVSGLVRQRGYRILSSNDLPYKQEYGSSITNTSTIFKKAYNFGRTMPGVVKHVAVSSTSIYLQKSSQFRGRTLNRLWMVLNGLAILLLVAVGLIARFESVLLVILILEVVVRLGYYIVQI